MKELIASARLILITILVCAVAYPLWIFGFARVFTPVTAEGSIILDGSGKPIGSERIAQEFRSPAYFWPRPSAVGYNASATGGSNLSPTNPKITERTVPILERLGTTIDNPAPTDLVTASGSGVDPDITEAAALYQIPRVAVARGIPETELGDLVRSLASYPGGVLYDADRIVNVLGLNLELDRLAAGKQADR